MLPASTRRFTGRRCDRRTESWMIAAIAASSKARCQRASSGAPFQNAYAANNESGKNCSSEKIHLGTIFIPRPIFRRAVSRCQESAWLETAAFLGVDLHEVVCPAAA